MLSQERIEGFAEAIAGEGEPGFGFGEGDDEVGVGGFGPAEEGDGIDFGGGELVAFGRSGEPRATRPSRRICRGWGRGGLRASMTPSILKT